MNEPPRKKQRKHIQINNQKNNGNKSLKSNKKRMNRQLTFPIHASYINDDQIKKKKRPKNEYVHIETLYHYSKPVV